VTVITANGSWPPDFGEWKPDDWEAFGTTVTAAVAVLAAIVAYFQVREARRLREEQARPFVVVDFESSPAWSNLINLVIKNVSNTLATDVRMEFDPPLKSSDASNQLPSSLLIREGIPTLPPGRRIHVFFDATHERIKTDLPLRYDVTVSFKDYRGRQQERLLYRLDLEPLYDVNYITEYGVHHAAKALREIEKLLKQKL
jgi:hypothetical protein